MADGERMRGLLRSSPRNSLDLCYDSWDPSINPPISTSGEFIGNYQGLGADVCYAIAYTNVMHLANDPRREPDFDHGLPRSPFQQLLPWRLPNTREFGGAKWPDCKRHHGDHDDDEDKDDKHGDRLRATAARAPVYRPPTRYWPHAWKRRGALGPMVISERGC